MVVVVVARGSGSSARARSCSRRYNNIVSLDGIFTSQVRAVLNCHPDQDPYPPAVHVFGIPGIV